MTPEVMTVEQVAEYLQLPAPVVLRQVRRGEIPAAKISRWWRVRKATVDAWLDERAQFTPEAFDRLLDSTWEAGKKAGINTAEDVDRLVAQVRAERQARGLR